MTEGYAGPTTLRVARVPSPALASVTTTGRSLMRTGREFAAPEHDQEEAALLRPGTRHKAGFRRRHPIPFPRWLNRVRTLPRCYDVPTSRTHT